MYSISPGLKHSLLEIKKEDHEIAMKQDSPDPPYSYMSSKRERRPLGSIQSYSGSLKDEAFVSAITQR